MIILHQDNMNAMKLEENGNRLSRKRTRHLNIKFFYVIDQIEQGWLKVKHCSTDKMWADINTKPLNGEPYRRMRVNIMNCLIDLELQNNMSLTLPAGNEPQECVGGTEGGARTVSWTSVVARGLAIHSTRVR